MKRIKKPADEGIRSHGRELSYLGAGEFVDKKLNRVA
jgi:hypothetical protein